MAHTLAEPLLAVAAIRRRHIVLTQECPGRILYLSTRPKGSAKAASLLLVPPQSIRLHTASLYGLPEKSASYCLTETSGPSRKPVGQRLPSINGQKASSTAISALSGKTLHEVTKGFSPVPTGTRQAG